nr:DNA methyltransferase [Candidatus Sigynarchaeota archaeon]
MSVDSIINHSCLDMYEVPDRSIHLVVTSPPYNVDIAYLTYYDARDYIEYVKFMLAWIGECVRALVDGGRIAINVANTGRKPYFHLSNLVINACLAYGLIPVEEYVWNKGRAIAAAKTSWGSWKDARNPYPRDCHELIEVF